MKKYIAVLLSLVMVLGLVACGGSKTEAPVEETAGGPAVAMITDYGDITDQSFNQTTYEACKAFCDANGVKFSYYKPVGDSDAERIASIEKAIDDGFTVIVTPGYAFAAALAGTAADYSDVTFIALDVSEYDLNSCGLDPIPANLYSAVYQEELCGFMAGVAAVKLGYTKLGFLGGMAVPAVMRYGYGFVQGCDVAAAEIGAEVELKYVYANQFIGDADITAYMDTWYADGTEVVFACGGGVYTSAAEAAAKVGGKIIGVDIDQGPILDAAYGEGITVTSATKGLAATVNALLYKVMAGEFVGGQVETLGLCSAIPAESYVQIAKSTQFGEGFTAADYEALVAAMFAGEITVSSDIVSEPAVTAITVDYQGNIK